MIKLLFPLLGWLCFSSVVYAQTVDLQNFKSIFSEGTIPDDFILRTERKFEKERDSLKKTDKDLLIKEEYLIVSNYAVDELLHSGYITFNDPISVYLNKVKDKILEREPGLRDSVKVYLYKSSVPNAFTYNNGIVFFSVGLFARMETEAQLAFVLAHEVTHFQKKHSMTEFVRRENKLETLRKSKQTGGFFGNFAWKDEYTFSKELEFEADKVGIQRILNSNYSTDSLSDFFRVLLRSDQPVFSMPFELSFFESSNFRIPKSLILNELDSAGRDADYDDTYSTHPNVKKRIESAEATLSASFDDKKRAEYIVFNEQEFRQIRDYARFELCNLYMQDKSYTEGIYHAYCLEKMYPGNPFLVNRLSDFVAAQLQSYYASRRSGSYMYKAEKGELQRLFFLFSKVSKSEFAHLAILSLMKLSEQHPHTRAKDNLKSTMALALKNDDFAYENLVYWDSPSITVDSMKQRRADTLEYEFSFAKYAMVDYPKTGIDSLIKVAQESNSLKLEMGKSLQLKLEEFEKYDEKNFGIDKSACIQKIVFITPTVKVSSYHGRKDNAEEHINSEHIQQELMRELLEMGEWKKFSSLDIELLDVHRLEKTEVDKFNDITVLYNFFKKSPTSSSIMTFVYEEQLREIVKKYKTPYFAWMGMVSTMKDPVETCLNPFAWFNKSMRYNTTFFVFVFDVETADLKMMSLSKHSLRIRPDLLKAFVYDTLNQLTIKR